MDFTQQLEHLINGAISGIGMGRYLAAFSVLILALLLRRICGYLIQRVLRPLTQKTQSDFDDILLRVFERPFGFLLLILGFFFAFETLQLPSEPINLQGLSRNVLTIMITFDLAWVLFNLVDLVEVYLARWVNLTESELDDHLLPFVRKTLRAFIIFIAVLLAAQNLGYSVSGLLAAGGIGGLALALAAKETLGNLFASIQLLADRPFHIGDWIVAEGIEGTVEEIGLRSTSIRTFPKTLIKVPNSKLSTAAIDNFSRMPKRRIKTDIALTYGTSPDQMRRFIEGVKEILRVHPGIDQEFSLVNFTEMADSSLNVMLYAFSSSTLWDEHLKVKQEVFLSIMELVEEMGLSFAFPSRSLYVESMPNPPSAASCS